MIALKTVQIISTKNIIDSYPGNWYVDIIFMNSYGITLIRTKTFRVVQNRREADVWRA
jgi:beta-mannanase